MNLNITKSTVIHPILFTVLPILLLVSSNPNEIIFHDALFSLLLVLSIMFASWFSLNLFLKNRLKSGLFVTLGAVLFFTYAYFLGFGSFLEVDVSTFPLSHHTYAIPIYFSFLIIGIFSILKIKTRLKDVTVFVNIIGIVLIVMLLPNIVSYSIETQNASVDNPLNFKILNESELVDKPNIYYIILDEYTSDEILLEVYGFDNKEFLSQLEKRGFEIPSSSYTNYVTSPLAITSNLNMQYVDEKNIVPTLDNKNEFFNNNQIMRILKSLDYTVINMSLEYGYPEIADHHLCPPSLFVNQFHSTLLDHSVLQPFSKYFVNAGDPQRDRINCKFSELSNLHNSFDSPFFVVAHIMAPHPPYLFGPNGESKNPEFLSIGANSWNNKSGYVDQVQFINLKLIETIDKILLENDSQPIIIVQGDHGTPTLLGGGGLRWNNVNDDSIIERMSIFNAYYFPNLDTKIIYDGVTPVNSFRLVLNNYLNGDYELLEDKMYFSTYQDMLNFTDVTSLLQN